MPAYSERRTEIPSKERRRRELPFLKIRKIKVAL